jgi:hypothetical protein
VTRWSATLHGNTGYSTRVGLLLVSVLLTVNGNEFYWKVEVSGVGTRRLERSDETAKLFPLGEVEQAKKAALKFAAEAG